MTKLTIILGKRIGRLPRFQLESMGIMTNEYSRIMYPEIFNTVAITVPMHPDDFIPETMEDILWRMEHGKNVQLWTMSEHLVFAVCEAVRAGKIAPDDVEVRLYADDNNSYAVSTVNSMGFLQDWPIGWFLPSA